MSNSTLKERLRARRQRLQDTADQTHSASEAEVTPRREGVSWGGNTVEGDMEEETPEQAELKESQALMKNLRRRRKQAQKELSAIEKDDPSAEEEMKTARLRTRDRLLAAKKAREASTADESEAADETDAGDDVRMLSPTTLQLPDTSRSETPSPRRSSRTPRSDSITPRKSVSKTMSMSIRQRLTDKINKAKEQGKEEIRDEARTSGRRLAGLRGMQRSTRFDDPALMRREDVEAEELLEKSMQLRAKWKETAEKTTKTWMPTQEQALDFFTRNWEPEPEKPKEVSKPPESVKSGESEERSLPKTPEEAEEDKEEGETPAEEEEAEATEDETVEETELTSPDMADDEEPLLLDADEPDTDAFNMYQMGRAEYKPFHNKMEDEAKVFFVPSILAAPVEKKIFDEHKEPRYLEDEGFYVGTKPTVTRRNVHKMENRLLHQKEFDDRIKHWFGEDGRLIMLPDPLKDLPSRPPILEEVDASLATDYVKAFPSELDSRLIGGSLEGQGPFQLKVDVNTLAFTHHHLFSREHVLAASLNRLYHQYLVRRRHKTAHFLSEKLRALKSASIHVQENIEMLKEKGKGTSVVDQEKRLQDYRNEIKQTRMQREQEFGADRKLLRSIIETWKQIKVLRQFQRCTNTPAKLTIKKVPVDKVADEAEWAEDLEDEMEDMRIENNVAYQQELAEYHQQLDAWKKQKLDKKDAQKRQKKRARRPAHQQEYGNEEELAQDEKDRDIIDEEDLVKPEKPPPPSDLDLKQQIMAKYEQIRRKPGEPKLYPELTSSATITQNHLCPRGEQQRRAEINRYRAYVRILFNSKEVSRTQPKPLGQDFTVQFAQIFTVQIVQWPESIKLEIYESAGLSSTLLSEVYSGIPDGATTEENVRLEDVEFSSDHRVNHSHEGVGSGVVFSLSSDASDKRIEMTSGHMSNSVCWAVDELGNVMIPPTASKGNPYYTAMKGVDAVAAIGASGMADMDKLTSWIAQSRLDPNDPSNADLMYLLRPVAGEEVMGNMLHMPDYFRLEQLQEEFDFATEQELVASRRYKLLQMREQEVQDFRNFKMVPAFDKEVPDLVFEEYEKKKREEEKVKEKDAVVLFMQKVREQVLSRFRMLAHQKQLPDMVYEEAVPNIGTIIPNLMKLTEPRRPLRPTRRERKKMTPQNLQQSDVKVLVNVVRAFDIPVRSDVLHAGLQGTMVAPGQTGGTMTPRPPQSEAIVRPFVEVMFQRCKEATTVAEGPNPSWNEELRLLFRAPNNDYSSTSLQSINDNIFINIFDEIIVDNKEDAEEQGTTIMRRIEKKWLGSIKIPFSTVYFNSRIDGTFKVNKPLILLGYEHDPSNTHVDAGMEMVGGIGDCTYLTMFITIEPPLTPADPVREKAILRFDTNEDDKLMAAAENWVEDLAGKFRKREFKATVIDINGKAVFITRYFKSLRPPEELVNNQETAQAATEKVVRFVSLIPFVSDTVAFPGVCDIWSTCDQFLQMLQGDEEEHAVLLVNYFLYMGKRAYLLVGSAIPEGPTSYVLTEEDRDFWIWNANTGQHYNYRDSYCPVQSVGCLVNPDNIWANIQPNDQPARIFFDIHNSSHWKPFFHKGFPHPGLSSVQPEQLIYTETDKSHALDVQDKVERMLKEKIMEWRPRHITRWNRYCIQAFRHLLPKLEANQGLVRSAQQHQVSDLESILGSYKLTGFPINCQYTGMESIIETVYSTGVHTKDTKDTEFALAVYVHPYPSNVLSVWIYVANLNRRR